MVGKRNETIKHQNRALNLYCLLWIGDKEIEFYSQFHIIVLGLDSIGMGI